MTCFRICLPLSDRFRFRWNCFTICVPDLVEGPFPPDRPWLQEVFTDPRVDVDLVADTGEHLDRTVIQDLVRINGLVNVAQTLADDDLRRRVGAMAHEMARELVQRHLPGAELTLPEEKVVEPGSVG